VADVYLDENVSGHVIPALGDLGHDAVSTSQLGNKGATDPTQLLAAKRLGRVLITHNTRDFRLLHETLRLWSEEWGVPDAERHAGIIAITPTRGMGVSTMAAIIDGLLQSQPSLKNRLFARNRRLGSHELD